MCVRVIKDVWIWILLKPIQPKKIWFPTMHCATGAIIENGVILPKKIPFFFVDINKSIVDINKSFVDINNSIVDINNSIVDINKSSLFLDINKWFVDINNSIVDINNSGVFALLACQGAERAKTSYLLISTIRLAALAIQNSAIGYDDSWRLRTVAVFNQNKSYS